MNDADRTSVHEDMEQEQQSVYIKGWHCGFFTGMYMYDTSMLFSYKNLM